MRAIAFIACAALGCSHPTATPSPPAASSPADVASASPNVIDPNVRGTSAGDASMSDAGAIDASMSDAGAIDAGASAAPSTTAGLRVANIGMHIGGGPNDDVTKAPIHKSVAPHFDAIARCFPANGVLPVDFGVDLVIEAKGGRAQVARPRTPLRDDAFIGCVVGVFQAIDFLPPRFGRTVVSYSLRFSPAPSVKGR
jgi:hypothetical protein